MFEHKTRDDWFVEVGSDGWFVELGELCEARLEAPEAKFDLKHNNTIPNGQEAVGLAPMAPIRVGVDEPLVTVEIAEPIEGLEFIKGSLLVPDPLGRPAGELGRSRGRERTRVRHRYGS